MMVVKARLDTVLVTKGLAENHSRAQALILSGVVYRGHVRLDKPGHQITYSADLQVRRAKTSWVSRGGDKLAHALDTFRLSVKNKICLDIGSSTGGFTDVLLKKGAAHVVAIDVGHGQLAWNLRNNKKVSVMERMNARYLTTDKLTQTPEIVVCDASFIGLKKVSAAALSLVAPKASFIGLIKPQFEVGKGRVGKGGVVRDPNLHKEVCNEVKRWLVDEMGWEVKGITPSPLLGPKGNREFLIYASHHHIK